MSFVNLMGNDLWSESDIDNKVQAMIRSRYSENDELKAARLARCESPSGDELNFVSALDSWVAECVANGRQARKDTVLLSMVLAVEEAQRRLSQFRLAGGKDAVTEEIPTIDEEGNPSIEVVEVVSAIQAITEFILDDNGNPTEVPNPEWERVILDDLERAAAQAVIDSASLEVKELVAQRKEAR